MKHVLLFLSLCTLGFSVPERKQYDVVVIGGGPAGSACATICAKTGYQTLLIDTEQNNLFMPPIPITNWPGFSAPDWKSAREILRKEYISFKGTIEEGQVTAVTNRPPLFYLSTETNSLEAAAVVVATGRRAPKISCAVQPTNPTRILSRLWNTQFFTPDDTVAIIGSGDEAVRAATKAALRAKKVYLIVPQKTFKETVLPPQFSTITKVGAQVSRLTERNQRVVIEYRQSSSKLLLSVSWVVFASEWTPNSECVKNLARLDSSGSIIVQENEGITSCPGLFACGEVSSCQFLTGPVSSAEGAQTGESVCRYLVSQKKLPKPIMPEQPKIIPPPPPPAEENEEE